MNRLRASYRHGQRTRSASSRPTGDAGAAARERVTALLDHLLHVDLQVVVVEPPDLARRTASDRARIAAVAAGRRELMEDAVEAVRDIATQAFSRGGFSGTWAATDMSASVVRSADRVAAAAAFEEAMLAAVAEDLLDAETLDTLRATADVLIDMTGIPSPGALSNLASPRSGTSRGPRQAVAVGIVVLASALLWIGLGLGFGILTIVLGLSLIAAVSRRTVQQT